MRPVRRMLVVLMIVTAVFTDRPLSAAAHLPQQPTLAGKVVRRLAATIQKILPQHDVARLQTAGGGYLDVLRGMKAATSPVVLPVPFGPFQFRLPPPSC